MQGRFPFDQKFRFAFPDGKGSGLDLLAPLAFSFLSFLFLPKIRGGGGERRAPWAPPLDPPLNRIRSFEFLVEWKALHGVTVLTVLSGP